MNLRPRRIDFDQVWGGGLRQTVEGIVRLDPLKKANWDGSFSEVYFLCVSIPESHGRRLHLALKECLENHTRSLLDKLRQLPSDCLLAEYNAEWLKFHKGAVYLQNLFGYLNRQLSKELNDAEAQQTFLPAMDDRSRHTNEQAAANRGIGNMALEIFRRVLIVPLSAQLVPLILQCIENDRAGRQDCSQAANVIESFVDANYTFEAESGGGKSSFSSYGAHPTTEFYESIFEGAFLQATANYYRLLTLETFGELDQSNYMERVIAKMEDERCRARRFLYHTTLSKVDRLCTQIMVREQLERFTAVCKEIIQQENKKDMHNMYRLLKPLGSEMNFMVNHFEEYIKRVGMESLPTAEPFAFVSSIQALHEKFTHMVVEVFSGDDAFAKSVDRALQCVVNHQENPRQPPKVSERLSRYIDSLLRKTPRGLAESELETTLGKAIIIFRYIADKDLFHTIYCRQLSTRLINGLSVSKDLEEVVINKMKDACGYEYTSKLQRMLTDISLSHAINERFTTELTKRNIRLEVPMSLMVLQAGAWPLNLQQVNTPANAAGSSGSSDADYAPPSILLESLKYFEEFYGSNHSGRKLCWLFGSSTAEVRLNYTDKAYIITASIQQLSILLCFSTTDSITIAELAAQTSLSPSTVIKCVKGFIDASILITAAQDQLQETSILTLNKEFTSRRLRFRVGSPAQKLKEEKEIDATCNTLQQDRKYYMECTLVRIMKARKVMKHSSLIKEAIKQTSSRFVPDVTFIKKNIEALIEKLYLQRTDDRDEYQYLA